ncbi:MAG: hypothetical protein ACO3CH_00290 [Ilumatobacteraceae bacterium]
MAETPEQQRARKRRRKREQELSAEMAKVIKFIPKGVSTFRIALNYARMKRNTGFMPSGLMGINPSLFKTESICRRTVLVLRNNGMIAQFDNGLYGITERGHLAIQLLQIREPSIHEPGDDAF